VWLERPTYFLVPKIFTSHGLVIKPLPMMSDREGDEHNHATGQIDIERMITMVEKDGVPPPKMIYIIPSYHNPTGRSMTTEERGKLATFAIRNNILLVADEVYHLLDWNRESNQTSRPAAMSRFNNNVIATCDNDGQSKGCCISVSSFTKIFAPGIRVGWIEAPPHIIQRLVNYAYINSQGGVAPFMGRLMAHAIETGMLDQYLDKLILEYSERCRLICNLLKQEPRINIITTQDASNREGGYFIWVQFPPYVDSEEFSSYCLQEHGVRFMTGNKADPFDSLRDNRTKQAIGSCARLCFADLDREKLEQGVVAFVEAFRSFCDQRQTETTFK
jgi:2-aminoadipate transaminase